MKRLTWVLSPAITSGRLGEACKNQVRELQIALLCSPVWSNQQLKEIPGLDVPHELVSFTSHWLKPFILSTQDTMEA